MTKLRRDVEQFWSVCHVTSQSDFKKELFYVTCRYQNARYVQSGSMELLKTCIFNNMCRVTDQAF